MIVWPGNHLLSSWNRYRAHPMLSSLDRADECWAYAPAFSAYRSRKFRKVGSLLHGAGDRFALPHSRSAYSDRKTVLLPDQGR